MDLTSKDVLRVLRRRIGKPVSVGAIVRSLKLTETWDSRATVICLATRLEERGEVECDYANNGIAFMVPEPILVENWK